MNALETQSLVVGYRAPLTDSLSLTLRAGEFVCLIGPNGAGKTTLLRTLAGMQRPLSGQVLIGGADIHRLPPAARASRLSIVLTERPQPGMLTGYGLVALGRYPHTDWQGRLLPHDEQVVLDCVAAVGAQAYAARPLSELSDGQRQKLMIARALAQDAPVMLLDEPTAFLDLPRRVELIHLLQRLARQTGRAVLLSTHDLDLALRSADRLWLLSDGILHDGAPEDLALDGRLEAAFRAEGVAFDSGSGGFRRTQPAMRPLRLVGEGAARDWTARALERAGFAAAETGAQTVVACVDDDRSWWQLWEGDACREFSTLYALIAHLSVNAEGGAARVR